MYNLYLMEVVNLPKYSGSTDETLYGPCSAYFHGVCRFEWDEQVGPCVGCPVHQH